MWGALLPIGEGRNTLSFDDLPAELVRFVTESIDSVELVHVLLSLQADPGREWSVLQLTRELRSTEASIQKRLLDLQLRGVLLRPEKSEKIRYYPADDEVRKKVDLLALAYRERPSRIIELIYSKPPVAIKVFGKMLRGASGLDTR